MATSNKSFFTVIGSNLIHSSENYAVSINYQGYEKEQEFQIGIVSTDEEEKEQYNNCKKIKLSGTNSETIHFELKDVTETSNYSLKVKSLTGETFEEAKELNLNLKKFSIFTQTDKSVYKPSDLIKFRILVLDAETKPFEDIKNIEVFVTDGADNRIKQFDSVKFTKGVYQNEIQLSDSPVLGQWMIRTKINAEESQKLFDVDEYVLPKFEVSIDANPDANFKDGKIRATVRAKYTFGKIAKGNATVTAEVVKHNYGWCGSRNMNQKIVSKTVEVDGKKFVEFDMKDDLKIEDHTHEHTVNLEATYKDDLSGKEAKATAKVQIHITPHKIELKRSSEKFKPELPFNVTAILQAHDKNAPVTDDRNPVKFVITSYYEILRRIKANPNEIVAGRKMKAGEDYECWEENFTEKEVKVFPINGIAKVDIDVAKNTKYFHVKAQYLETQEQIHRTDKEDSESNQYILAKLLTESLKLSEKLAIQIFATEELKELSYQVIGRGKLIETKTVKIDNLKNYTLEVTPNLMMIPKANVIIFYITSDGEIISDKIEIEFGNELINHIDLKLSKNQAKPGEDLDISISTRPNSFVGLLGVDQSVLLLKKGNDIEQSTVFDELEKYGQIDHFNYGSSRHYRGFGCDEDFHNFTQSNAVIITNAKKPIEDQRRVKRMNKCARMHDGSGGMLFGGPQAMRNMQQMPVAMAFSATAGLPEGVMMDCSFDSPGGSSFQRKPIEIRKEFPETWLFDSFDFDSSENKTLRKKVPDTITSWIITGFSVDPSTGLGLTKESTKLNVFQPFFVTTNLPYSIKRGEVVAIPIIVFNYLENDQNAQVTLFNKDHEFEFVDVAEDNEDSKSRPKRALESEKSKTVDIKSNEGATISFMIRPLKVGQITIKVTAESDVAGDGLEKQLRVEPEGVTQYMNEAVFIDLRKDDKFSKKIEINVPENAVSDSTKVEASAIGDILGSTIENLNKLIQLPYGCGEQNMLNFVPNIVVLDYLITLKKLTPEIEERAKKYMEVGYQKELTYKHDDGSYSAFGKSDKSGSTWLTAFVAKSFNQASRYISVDTEIITQALQFLKTVQLNDGSFPEVGYVCHRDMQGGSSKGIALTAYTLITFLENKNQTEKYQDVIKKAQDYIIKNCEELKDDYSLAIAAYALQLAQHESKDSFINRLDGKSENKDGMKYWKKEEVKNDDESKYWHYKPNSVNVEMSAYALQAFIEASRDSEAVPIMKWLITQRNENGGFQSTQDTVVGLQALSKLGAKIYVPNNDIKIAVKSDDKQVATISLNQGNALILQKHEMPSDARHFEIEATGKGFSVLQISYKYNLDDSGKFPRFVLKPVVEEASNKEFLHLTVCTNFVADAQVDKSNMAIMEVTLPSGFTFDSDHLSELLATARVKKVETKDDETIVMVYFDDIDAKEHSIQIKAYRKYGVAKLKPAPIVIYDYYDNTRCARTFYNPPEISLNDISQIEVQ